MEASPTSLSLKEAILRFRTLRTGGGEAVTTLGEDLHEVVSQVTASQVQTEDGMGQSVTWNTAERQR